MKGNLSVSKDQGKLQSVRVNEQLELSGSQDIEVQL